MIDDKIKIAVIPLKRGSKETANTKENKKALLKKLEMIKNSNVEYFNLESVIDGGIVRDGFDVDPVLDFLKSNEPDAIFLAFMDFGCEIPAGRIASSIRKPVLVWGGRDKIDYQTGIRITNDTQCGIIAATKVLQNYGVKFTYIPNIFLDDPLFEEGVDSFSRVASVVKAMNNMKIAHIGSRPDAFLSVMTNEEDLLTKFGIEVTPIYPGDLENEVSRIVKSKSDEFNLELNEVKTRIDVSQTSPEKFERAIALKIAVKRVMEKNKFSAAATSCWNELQKITGTRSCLIVSELTGMGMPISCEADINGAVSLALLSAANFNQTSTFFPDLTMRHPDNENAELLWHCGPFPYVLKEESCKAELVDGWCTWELKKGNITVVRFSSHNGYYSLFTGEGKTVDGPKTHGTYAWLEVDDWEKWEKKLVYGPYIHHVACMYGNYSRIMKEACKYIPGLIADDPDKQYYPGFND